MRKSITTLWVLAVLCVGALAPAMFDKAQAEAPPQYVFVIELDDGNPCSPTWLFAAYPSQLRAEEDILGLQMTYPNYRPIIHTLQARP
jgi:hypothetical protein